MFGRRIFLQGIAAIGVAVTGLKLAGSQVVYRLKGLVSPQARWSPVKEPYWVKVSSGADPQQASNYAAIHMGYGTGAYVRKDKMSMPFPEGRAVMHLTPEDLEPQDALVVMRLHKPAESKKVDVRQLDDSKFRQGLDVGNLPIRKVPDTSEVRARIAAMEKELAEVLHQDPTTSRVSALRRMWSERA